MAGSTTTLRILLVCVGAAIFSSAQVDKVSVISILSEPYLIEQINQTTGEATYSGFIVDLLDEVSKMVGFDYSISLVKDGTFGWKRDDGNWTGMIGELTGKTIDLAAAPLTIMANRQEMVDFSVPFQSLAPAILLRKPLDNQPNFVDRLLRLFVPMTSSVWLHSLIGMLATGIVLYIISYYSPVEWRKMAINNEASERERESFTCMNSFWFVASCLAWQGYEKTPRSIGARFVVFFWWMFCALFIITYMASLTNFLRIISLWDAHWSSLPPVTTLVELSSQNALRYGMLDAGATKTAFQESDVPYLKNIYSDIVKRNAFFPTIEKGLAKVRESYDNPYAFIIESTMGLHLSHKKPCDLALVIDPLVAERFYAFAYKPGWNHAAAVNHAILVLRENGALEVLKNLWWKNECLSFEHVLQKPVKESFYSVTLGSFSGSLIMLALGLILGCIISAFECLITRRQGKKA